MEKPDFVRPSQYFQKSGSEKAVITYRHSDSLFAVDEKIGSEISREKTRIPMVLSAGMPAIPWTGHWSPTVIRFSDSVNNMAHLEDGRILSTTPHTVQIRAAEIDVKVRCRGNSTR
jgi:hypothetical protein